MIKKYKMMPRQNDPWLHFKSLRTCFENMILKKWHGISTNLLHLLESYMHENAWKNKTFQANHMYYYVVMQWPLLTTSSTLNIFQSVFKLWPQSLFIKESNKTTAMVFFFTLNYTPDFIRCTCRWTWRRTSNTSSDHIISYYKVFQIIPCILSSSAVICIVTPA